MISRLVLIAALLGASTPALAATQQLNAVVYSQAPSNSALIAFNFDCMATGVNCSPIVELGYNGSPLGTGGSGIPLTVAFASGQTLVVNAGTNLNTSALAVESGGNLAAINGKLNTTASGLKVDGSSVTQPVSGSLGRSWSLSSASDTVTALVSGSVSVTGTFWPATQPVSGSLGRSWTLSNVSDTVSATISGPVTVIGSPGRSWSLSSGTDTVTATIGNTVNVNGTFWQATQPVSLPVQTSGGWSSIVVTNLTNPVVIKATGGNIGSIQCDNMAGSAIAYVQIIDAGTSPAFGASVIGVVPLPAGSTGGKTYPLPGVSTANGIAIGFAASANGLTAAATPGNCEVDFK